MNENEPPEASTKTRCPQNRGLPYVSGAAWQVPTYGPCGDRCRGGMTIIQAFVRNLRTGSVMLRDKAQSGEPTRPKVPMHWPGAHCFVVASKRSNVRGAKGAGHPRQDGVNGQSGGTPYLGGSRAASSGWHEPDESRGSRPDLWAARGEIPQADPARLGNYRRSGLRYDRSLTIYRGFFHIACVMIVLRKVLK